MAFSHGGLVMFVVVVALSHALGGEQVDTSPQVFTNTEKGYSLVMDGHVRTMTEIRNVPVLISVIPDNLLAGTSVCNGTIFFYEQLLQWHEADLRDATRGSRQKRFISTLSFLTGLFGSALGIKSWMDMERVERDVAQLHRQQEDLQHWAEAVREKLSENFKMFHDLTIELSTSYQLLHNRTRALDCKVTYLLMNIASISQTVQIIAERVRGVIDILSQHLTQYAIRLVTESLRAFPDRGLDKWYTQLGSFDHLSHLVSVIPGRFNFSSWTLAAVIVLPVFDKTDISTYRVLNTGYVGASGEHRMCDIHGVIAYHMGSYYRIHPVDCAVRDRWYYCPPHALTPDHRFAILNKTGSCPPSEIMYDPIVDMHGDWIACTTLTRKILIEYGSPPVWQRQERTSTSGYFIVHRQNVHRLTVGQTPIYYTMPAVDPIQIKIPMLQPTNIPEDLTPDTHIPEPVDIPNPPKISYISTVATARSAGAIFLIITTAVLFWLCYEIAKLKASIKDLSSRYNEMVLRAMNEE